MASPTLYHGTIITSSSPTTIDYLEDALLAVSATGVIDFVQRDVKTEEELRKVLAQTGWEEKQRKEGREVKVVRLRRGEFLMPGLIDTHTHAPQYPNIGAGQQFELLDWLHRVTFPREKKFADTVYAKRTYEQVVQRVIDVGTTTCCWFATHHLEATQILADICYRKGQRAFVGKCNMDRNSSIDYVEKSAAQSVEDTKTFIRHVRQNCCRDHTSSLSDSLTSSDDDAFVSAASTFVTSPTTSPLSSPTGLPTPPSSRSSDSGSKKSSTSIAKVPGTPLALVQPILTPRFAISCSDALLTSLGALVHQDPTLMIQTHLAENPAEIEFTRKLFPFADSYTHVYDHFNLLNNNTILAHCVHLTPDEISLIRARGSGVSHCPTSNFNLRSGASRVGDLLDAGLKVGLGTDVSGGWGMGILTALRQASVSSKVLCYQARDGLLAERATDSAPPSRGRSETRKVAGGTDGTAAEDGVDIEVGDDGVVKAHAAHVRDSIQVQVDRVHSVSTDGQSEQRSSSTTTTVRASSTTPAPAPKKGGSFFSEGHLPLETLFYLATQGGAIVCGLGDRVGELKAGKEFDALLISTGQKSVDETSPKVDMDEMDAEKIMRSMGTPVRTREDDEAGDEKLYNPALYIEPEDNVRDVFEKFLFTGDDRNISSVFVRGRRIGGACPIRFTPLS